MDDKVFILNIARNQCMKNLEKSEERVTKFSEQLSTMDDNNSTMRRRSMQRVNLTCECEGRDRWVKRIDLIDKWMDVEKANGR
jgi:hypothetical protein